MTFPRVRALIFVAVLFVTAGVVVLTAINKDSQANPRVVDECAPGEIRVNIDVLDERQVTLNVYNGSNSLGLGDQIGAELANRGFNVALVERAPEGQQLEGVGAITYGPQGVGAGWLVKAYFLDGELEEHFVPEREGPEVDLVLGNGFQQLTTTTEVNQRIAQLQEPEPPPGTCAA